MSGSDSPTFFHGQPWSSWIERIGRDKPLSDDETEAQPSSSVTRLSVDDIDLYGFCPERDTFYGVVCEICNAIVKPQALIQHMESRHPSGTTNFPTPPTPIVKPTVKTPYCKVSKLKKTQSSPQIPSSGSGNSSSSNPKVNHTSLNKRSSEQTSTSCLSSSSPRSPLESIQDTRQPSNSSSSGLVGVNSPVKSPGSSGSTGQQTPQHQQQQQQQQHRRKRLKADRSLLKDREYDPDRHCGVWNDETGKPCTRSLTCKAHTVSLRRTVAGRSKTFDKLLAEHRASKEIPTRPASAATTKLSLTGTVSLSSASSSLNSLAPSTPVSSVEPEAPSSPPVLSLPDTYPLPKAVDLLYRCLAPHGSTKPTKLEEDFDASEELRSLESTLAGSSSAAGGSVVGGGGGSSSLSSSMAPISVALPSLSPIPSGVEESPPVATLVPVSGNTVAIPTVSPGGHPSSSTSSSSSSSATSGPASVAQPTTSLPTTCPPTVPAAILESEISGLDLEIEPSVSAVYSPVYKDVTAVGGKSSGQLVVGQVPRANNHVHPRGYHPMQAASMPSLSIFEPVEQLEQQHAGQINGKRLNHAAATTAAHIGNQVGRQTKRNKQDYQQEYSTAIQVEATTTSTPYPQFNDITWSNCHPEPLAVSRWLRLTSSRKQYNFNIH